MSRHLRILLALVATFALVAAGCGDDDDDTSSTDDTETDDTEAELSDEEVLEEFCAIDADLDELDADLEAAFEDEDLDALRDSLDENLEIASGASDLPLDVIEDGLEDELAEYLDETRELADDLADAEDFDAAIELVTAYGEEQSTALSGAADEHCETDDTTPETDDTTPETDDTTPDTVESDGIATGIVESVLGGTQYAGGSEQDCIVEGLEESFDDDELQEFAAADSFTEDQAAALSDVFEPCLPYQDLIAAGVEGQLGDAAVEACVVDAYEGYDWQGVFADTDGERALIEETIQTCSGGASGDTGAPTPNPPGTVVDFLAPNIGDCWNDADATGAEYTVVDCAEPHDWENYALVTLPDGAFPGDDAVLEAGVAACIEQFEAYVGTPYAESAIFADRPLPPTADTWEAGDREVICRLYSPDGPLEGSGYQSGT